MRLVLPFEDGNHRMSNSRTRNFRRRADDDDDNDNTPSAITPSAKKSLSSKPKKLLSFADDDEEKSETLTINREKKQSSRLSKPSSSHKLAISKDRLPPPSSTSLLSYVQPQSGIYTKEALLELQKNTKTLAVSSSKPTVAETSSEPKVILKGSIKPQVSSPVQQKISQDSSDSDSDSGNVMENIFSSRSTGKIAVQPGVIYDEAAIKAIRAKKDRIRQQSQAVAPDYVSLDGGSGSSHRVDAEGLSDEELEFPSRMAMNGVKREGVFEHNEEHDARPVVVPALNVDDECDDEDKMWEEEQVRKGLGKRLDDSTARVVTNPGASITMAPQQQKFYSPVAPTLSIGGAIGVSQGFDAMSIAQKADIAMKALQDNVNRLKETHARTLSSLTKTDEDLSSSLLKITDLEKSLSAAGEKFIFMQKLRDYVSVICDFLQDKALYIETLEEEMQKLNKERASAIVERRAADSDDEMREVEAAVKAATKVFNERGNSAAILVAANGAAQAAVAAIREQTNLPVKLDEFGRDMNLKKRMDVARRAEARQCRRARFDSKRLSLMDTDVSYQKLEGESTTDESESESAAYQSNREELLKTADQIFSDASEEYSELSLVKERFEKWKSNYSLSYHDAYMSLSAPTILSPYVRLELLKWDPLHKHTDFSDMKWHSLLFNYGLPEDGKDFARDDTDANLVPTLVEKVAVPILHHEIVNCWDSLSTQETKNAVSATGLVMTYVPTSSEALKELLVAIRTRLAEAVSNIVVPTWSPVAMNAVPNAARSAAYRFGMSVRLMRNICLWKEIFALPILEKLAIDELLCRKVLPHVQSITSNVHDAITRTERIVASLSGVWSGPSVTGSHSHKLQPLVDFILLLGKTLEKKHLAGVPENETAGFARRLKKMLVELNEYDNARDIARTFHLKEAL